MIKVSLPATQTVVVSPADTRATVKVKPSQTTTVSTSTSNRINVGINAIGPAGRDGVSEEEMIYSKRTDFIGEDVIYRGEAAVGSSADAPVWRIRRITIGIDGDVAEEWANSTASFVHAWNDRATYNYE